MTSPSATTYSLPTVFTIPALLASFQPPAIIHPLTTCVPPDQHQRGGQWATHAAAATTKVGPKEHGKTLTARNDVVKVCDLSSDKQALKIVMNRPTCLGRCHSLRNRPSLTNLGACGVVCDEVQRRIRSLDHAAK